MTFLDVLHTVLFGEEAGSNEYFFIHKKHPYYYLNIFFNR